MVEFFVRLTLSMIGISTLVRCGRHLDFRRRRTITGVPLGMDSHWTCCGLYGGGQVPRCFRCAEDPVQSMARIVIVSLPQATFIRSDQCTKKATDRYCSYQSPRNA